MNRKLLPGVMVWLCVALSGAARAQSPAPNGSGASAQSAMPPALRTPEPDPAQVELAWQAAIKAFPEIVAGPERDGVFVIALALRPDGSVVRSGMRYADSNRNVGEHQQALRADMPGDTRAIRLQSAQMQRKGATLPGGRVLQGMAYLNAMMVPVNWDATRDSNIVRRAVTAKYADLFLPTSGEHVNELVLAMTDDGEIAQGKVNRLDIVHNGSGYSITGGCRIPPTAGTMLPGVGMDAAAAVFAPLGLAMDQIGPVGKLNIDIMPAVVTASAPSVGANGIARIGTPFDRQMLFVCYAWPRRAGEPVGGTPLAWDSIPRAPEPANQPTMDISRMVRQYFPPGSPSNGNWMLLTFNGEVLRTGHVELGQDEQLTNVWLQRRFPGIKVSSSMSMSTMQVPPPDAAGAPPAPPAMIRASVFFLAQDSPLPPAEDLALPAR